MPATKQIKPTTAATVKLLAVGLPTKSIGVFADKVMKAATTHAVQGFYVPSGLRRHSGGKALGRQLPSPSRILS